jgi:alkyl hydroperoxide reductase subunit F
MLDADLKAQLKGYLQRIVQPITLVATVDDGTKSREMVELLEDIAAQSDKVSISLSGEDARRPSFAIQRVGAEAGVRFAGLPLGHEFTSLVLALLQVGGHPPRVEADVIAQVRALPGDYHFETYFSQSCQNCPDVVQALNTMSVINPRIRHTAIDGALFPDEVERRQVMAVPTVLLNGEPFAQGRMGLEEILAKLDTGAAGRAAEAIKAKAPFEVLVIGGGPAGAAAAIYAARKGIRTGLAVDVMLLQRATRLIPAAQTGGLIEVELEGGASLKARSVVLATGARWKQMNVPGEAEYRNKGVTYCPHCDGPLFKGKRVAVIGGGNSGVEAAIDLAGLVAHVTLIEFDGALRADAVLQRKLASLPNVTVITSGRTTQVRGDGAKVVGLTYEDRTSGALHEVALDGIFVQIGLAPNTEWLAGAVALTPYGEIETDGRGHTSLPGVFAAGDATTTPFKQIVIAMGEGSRAALSAFDYLIRLEPAGASEMAAAA